MPEVVLYRAAIQDNPIHLLTCLSTTKKLLSDIIAAKMSRRMGQYISGAQKGISKDTRGANHQLLTDRADVRDCRAKQNNLCTAWIDSKKAQGLIHGY